MPRSRFTDEDVMGWVRRREAGEPLREIAAEYAVSTQYVSMMTNRHQRRPWPTAEERPNHDLDALVDRINAWLRHRSTTTIDRVKQEFQLTSHQWNLIWKRLDNTRFVGTLKPESRVERYDDDAVQAALREAYEKNGCQPITGEIYERLRDRDRHPSVPTIHNRFGSWAAACGAAGVPFGGRRKDILDDTPAQRWSTWPDDEILRWVRTYRAALGPMERPSYNGYDTWQRTREGAPSGSLVRVRLKHLGGWGDILTAAAQDLPTNEQQPVPVVQGAGGPAAASVGAGDADLFALLTNDGGTSDAELAGFFDAVAADTHEFVGWPVDASRCLYCGESDSATNHPRHRRCPACGSTELIDIVYGMPTPEAYRNPPPNIRFGGCCRDPFRPDVCCATCGAELTDKDGVLRRADELNRILSGSPGGSFGVIAPDNQVSGLADLRRIVSELGQAQSVAKELTARRDELITDLLDERVATGDEIGAMAGLTQPRTSQIRRRVATERAEGRSGAYACALPAFPVDTAAELELN